MSSESSRTEFRPLTVSDLPLLHEWLARPHVAEWWSEAPSLPEVERRLGQGLGSAMIGAFVDRLFEDPAITRVQADPAPHNARAIRCYERVGFRASGEVETPDGRALLMYADRASRAEGRPR